MQILTKKIPLLVYIVFIAKTVYCYDDTRLNFLVFENHYLTSNVFTKEQSNMVIVKRLLKSLKQMGNILISKTILSWRYMAHPRNIFHASIKRVDLLNNSSILLNIQRLYNVLQQFQKLLQFQYDFGMSTKDVMHGARKGILILYETYKPNIATFSKGVIYSNGVLKGKSREIDRLAADDAASISIIAIDEFNWFHTSTIFWNETYNILNHRAANNTKYKHLDFEKVISALIHRYWSYFNVPIYNKKEGGNQYRNEPSIEQGI